VSSSISFDRAAGYYDKTRGLPKEQAQQVTDLLAAELSGRDRTLEIGVGTGRIALPLHDRGIDLVGIDISVPMLERLVANASGRQPFPLLVADATRLPFADDAYDAVVASHIFHLVPEWKAAADEALRVVAPAGVILVDIGYHGAGHWHDLMVEVFRQHGVERERVGVTDREEFADYVAGRAAARDLAAVTLPVRASYGEILAAIEGQITSWTWSFSPEQLHTACEAARDRARAEGIDLEEAVNMPYTVQWRAYDVASG
jgi:ubiquinone/menaquinone biosynthesis C-methylase UbiE